ncbi:hypothetical protein MMC22_006414 [Lobaria immixta]|nr:hypothetical protein [Lobaria immixta]
MENAREFPELRFILRNCSETVRSRAFFTTTSKHFGFGPKYTAAGDQVFLLIGSDLPLILRPAGDKFELIGACYAHGIMYGECLHQYFGFNNQFYPGSTPGAEWNFNPKVDPVIWRAVAPNNNYLHSDGFIWHELASIESNDVADEYIRRGARRFKLYEEERDPVFIEAERVILK